MRIKQYVLMVIITVSILLFTSCSEKTDQQMVTDALGVNVEDAIVTSSINTHGGFHGDGTTFIELNVTGKSCLNEIKENSDWKELPLSDNLTAIVYGRENENCRIGPYLTNLDGKTLFPQIVNGYYYFKDRQKKGTDTSDDSEVLERNSFNVTFAIYDVDTNILYYCEFDT